MKKNKPDWEGWQCNHIANITIVDGYLNKNKIRAKAPADYMSDFKDQNEYLSDTMRSHLIDNLEHFGVWGNDYGAFFEARVERISQELTKKIISQKTSEKLAVYEDTEELETSES